MKLTNKEIKKSLDIRTIFNQQRAFKALTNTLLTKNAQKLMHFQRKLNVIEADGLVESENGSRTYMQDDNLQKELVRLTG